MSVTKSQQKHQLPVASLYHICDESEFDFETTEELQDIGEDLGQQRAMDALKFGIGMRHEGYNLFVLGSTGLGKHTAVHKLLDKESRDLPTPDDWCYVNNFDHPHTPRVLKVPAGRGLQLKQDMEHLIEELLIAIPAVFQSDEYRIRVQEINDHFKEIEEKAFTELAENAEKKNITMIRTPGGYTLGPVHEGHILTPEEFEKLPEDEQEQVKKVTEEVEQKLVEIIRKVPTWQRENREQLKALTNELAQLTVDQFVDELITRYQDLPEVEEYIATVKQHIVDATDVFVKFSEEKQSGNHNQDMIRTVFSAYQVNVLVDNGKTEGAPVIYEDNPTYLNLIGRIEHRAQFGTLLTDFSLIKAGALHKANGGYLILDVRKVLTSPFSYEGLKRVLRARELRIESLEQSLSLASTISLQPEPIPIDVKVILTGNRMLYYLLKQLDPEFNVLFKVAADFAEDIERDADNTHLYARLIATLQRETELSPIDRSGVARIIEHCSRMVSDGEKLSLHKGDLLDLIKESDYWRQQDDQPMINRSHVQKTIDTRRYRLDQIRECVHEQVLRDIFLLDTSGEKAAQINGLSVIQLGDHAFGRPVRITATARLGAGKVIDIEREVHLGGSIHSKGVLILSSFLANRYAPEQPLSLSASLVFEQSYGMIEGDSASAAELCVLLSALSGVGIKQSLAVTGSVNQLGEIQAIGGANEKIEGFFDICQARGLSGEQGVIIPHANISHLMLRQDVRDAVEQGQFAIYAVHYIDELLELLTGVPAGEADSKGRYPDKTVNGLVQKKLRKLNKLRKQFGRGEEVDDGGNEQGRPYARKH